jgi:hypothetical protein
MKLDPILTKATRLARSGNFDGAIKTLEPEVNRYLGSFRYYYLLGVSCLHSGDFGGALTYFKLAREVKIRDPQVLLGMAVLYLRRGNTQRAVDYYLEVQDLDENNRIVKKALKVIRKYAGQDNLSAWIESGKLPKLYPPIPSEGFSLRQLLVPAAAAAVLLLGCGLLIRFRVLPNPFKAPGGGRQGSTEIYLDRDEKREPVENGGTYRYIFTRVQVLDTYEKALRLFTEYRDEAAKVNINRILESNASPGVKNKSRIILSYMAVPGFDSFKRDDNVSYSDVMKDPLLYRNVHVIWRGMATNVVIEENVTAFDLLVGYDTRHPLEGVVTVIFDRAVAVNTERTLEILGRIVPVSTGRGIQIQGVAIHQSGLPE